MTLQRLSGLLLPLLFCTQGVASLGAEPPIRVLIVDGYSHHDWRLTTALARAVKD
jgi:hypothetical protein